VRRGIEPFKGLWSLPGGFVEYDEAVEDFLIMEVKEEVGLDIKPVKVVGIYSQPTKSPIKHVVTICYQCIILSGEVKTSNENIEARFFTLENLPGKLAFNHLTIIREYLKSK